MEITMKRNFNVALRTLDNTPLTETALTIVDGKQLPVDRPLTLASIAVNALLAPYEDERGLSGDEKVRRYKLAQAIHAAPTVEVEVSAEQIAMLKSLIAKSYAPLVVGQAYALLEEEA